MGNVAETLSEYEKGIIAELDQLHDYARSTNELKYVINEPWVARIKEVVATWGPQKKFTDGGYNFYRILAPLLQAISPEELERRLQLIEATARKQGRLNQFRKTRNELGSTQNNQILGSMFELTIVSRVIENFSGVQVFPKINQTEQDVEAAIILNDRQVFIEAKAIGYSDYDPKGRVGSQCIESMKRQVRDALSDINWKKTDS